MLFIFWLQTLASGMLNVPKIIVYYRRYPVNMLFALFLFIAPFVVLLPAVYMFTYIFLNPDLIGNFVLPSDYKIFSDFASIFATNTSIFVILVINEIYLFFSKFIGEGEYKEGYELPATAVGDERVNDPTFGPFGRVFALVILALVGFLPTLMTHSTMPSLILLVIGKIAYDIQMEMYLSEKGFK